MRRTYLLLVALLLASCLPNNEPEDPLAAQLEELQAQEDLEQGDAQDVGSLIPAESTAPDPLWSIIKLERQPIVEIEEPTGLATRSGSFDLWITQKSGLVRRVSRSFSKRSVETIRLLDAPILDITEEVGPGGLLNLTFSSDGRKLYVIFVDVSGDVVVSQYTMTSRNVADVESRRELIRATQVNGSSFGGGLAFGPDGFLYIGMGDGGGDSDPEGHAQNDQTWLGSVLRIDTTATETTNYVIPAGNPFVEDPVAKDEIWMTGVHNASRLTFDSATGDFWLADTGQDKSEEINVFTPGEGGGWGKNLGWSLVEGGATSTGAKPTNYSAPYLTYTHNNGRCQVTGGEVYRGKLMEALSGVYIYGDFCTGEIFGVERTAEGPLIRTLAISAGPRSLASFGVDDSGEIYVVEETGLISRIRPFVVDNNEGE